MLTLLACVDWIASTPDGSEAAPACTYNSDCDDEVDCTLDRCGDDGTCINTGADALCVSEVPCEDGVCSTSRGCVFTPSIAGTSCSNDACTVDTCDGAGSCVSSAEPAPAGTECVVDIPCAQGWTCADWPEDEVLCGCACLDGGGFEWLVSGVVADSKLSMLRSSAFRITLSDGTRSEWVSCPSQLGAMETFLPTPERINDVTVELRLNPSTSDYGQLSAWYYNFVSGKNDLRTAQLVVLDSDLESEIASYLFLEVEAQWLEPFSDVLLDVGYSGVVDLTLSAVAVDAS